MNYPNYQGTFNNLTELENLLEIIETWPEENFYKAVENIASIALKLERSKLLLDDLNAIFLDKSSPDFQKHMSLLLRAVNRTLAKIKSEYSAEILRKKEVETYEISVLNLEMKFERFFQIEGYISFEQFFDDYLVGDLLISKERRYFIRSACVLLLLELKESIEGKIKFLMQDEGSGIEEIPHVEKNKHRMRLILMYETGVLDIFGINIMTAMVSTNLRD